MRFKYSLLITLIIVLIGCGMSPVSPDLDTTCLTDTVKSSTHISWGQWKITLDPDLGIASAVPIRDVDFHIDVTTWLEPPNCDDCIQIIITAWDPVERIADVTMILKNPTELTGYDVKAIISDYDTKEFLEPDAYADFYTDGFTWDPYYLFATDGENHAFEGEASHAVGFQVYFPLGATPNATVTVDASWPDPQAEPWRIDNIVVAGPLQNDNYHHIAFTCHIRDHYDDVQVVIADLTPVGPDNAAMGDDSFHKDYLPNDGIWGLDNIKTKTFPGTYEVWIRARSNGSDSYTYQKLELEVIYPILNPPPLYIVSMMHAEESDFYLNEEIYLGYSETLRGLMQVFDNHDAKIAFQPDWTFIQGTMNFDPTFFSDFQAIGHGVDAHAHETVYDLGEVHDFLDDAGVQDTIIANGGFNQTWGDDGNWAAYIAHFVTGGAAGGKQMFQTVVAYKDPASQSHDSLYTPIRPSTTGDWMIHDPEGPLVYIPGAPTMDVAGTHPLFFELLPNAVDYAIAGVIPDRVNCFYWHDPAGQYNGSPLSMARLNFWNILLSDYFDKKVDDGDVVWANFNEMYQAYIDWEADNDD